MSGIFNAGRQHPTVGAAVVIDNSSTLFTINTGNNLANGAYKTGSDIDSYLTTACTDITDPSGSGGWNAVWNLSSGFPKWVQFIIATEGSNNVAPFYIKMSNEDAGDALRMQLIIDSNTIFDFHAIANGTNTDEMGGAPTQLTPGDIGAGGGNTDLIYVESTIQLNCARKGNIAQSTTVIIVPQIIEITFDY